LITPYGTGSVWMNLDMAGVDHQPFIVRLINQLFQQGFPDPFIPPATKAAVGVFPVTVTGWQIPPGSAGTQNPEDGIDKQAIIACNAAPTASPAEQMGFK